MNRQRPNFTEAMRAPANTCTSLPVRTTLPSRPAVTGLWFLAITVLSFLPLPAKTELATRGSFHTPAHIVIFGISTLVAWRSMRQAVQRRLAYAAVIGYGALIEVAQSRINRTTFEWDDLAADIAGVVLALILVRSCRVKSGVNTGTSS
jgi:VanZ family protein